MHVCAHVGVYVNVCVHVYECVCIVKIVHLSSSESGSTSHPESLVVRRGDLGFTALPALSNSPSCTGFPSCSQKLGALLSSSQLWAPLLTISYLLTTDFLPQLHTTTPPPRSPEGNWFAGMFMKHECRFLLLKKRNEHNRIFQIQSCTSEIQFSTHVFSCQQCVSKRHACCYQLNHDCFIHR